MISCEIALFSPDYYKINITQQKINLEPIRKPDYIIQQFINQSKNSNSAVAKQPVVFVDNALITVHTVKNSKVMLKFIIKYLL